MGASDFSKLGSALLVDCEEVRIPATKERNPKDLSGSEAEIRKKSWEQRYIGRRRAGAMSKTAFGDGASA